MRTKENKKEMTDFHNNIFTTLSKYIFDANKLQKAFGETVKLVLSHSSEGDNSKP